MNINEHRKGWSVEVLPTARGNYLDKDFPGWGKPGVDEHLKPIAAEAGMRGVVISVNSHGMPPYTRYSIRLANGGHLTDGVPGTDFKWTVPGADTEALK